MTGKTVEELRDRSHSFGKALQELYDNCDLVCSAPLVAILSGEHSGVDGSLMLLAPLPRRVYVGLIGRAKTVAKIRPILSSFRYYDPLSDEVQNRTHNPEYLGAEENLRNLGKILENVVEEEKSIKFKFLPCEVVVLSESPPGRGANWSGAFAVALSLALYLLQGEVEFPPQLYKENWKNTNHTNKRDEEIQIIYRLALKLECISHSLASGYGPASALLPALGRLLIYKGFINPDYSNASGDHRRNAGFFITDWNSYQSRLQSSKKHKLTDLYDIIILDSGENKSTATNIANVRGNEENKLVQDFLNMFNESENQPEVSLLESRNLSDRILIERRVGLSTLAVASALAIKTLRDCLAGIDDVGSILRVISSIDEIHRRLGLSFDQLDVIRQALAVSRQNNHTAVKFTGGGKGGNIIIWGLSDSIKNINPRLFEFKGQELPVIWQLSRDGLAQEGATCNWQRPTVGNPKNSYSNNFPYDFHRISSRDGQDIQLRPHELLEALVLDSKNNLELISDTSNVFELYNKLRYIYGLKGTCIYLYSSLDAARDRSEPIYLTWPSPDNLTLLSFPFKPRDGSVMLKKVLFAFIDQIKLTIDANELIDREVDFDQLVTSRGALNRETHELERDKARGRVFPKLSLAKPDDTSFKLPITLRMPENSHLILVRTCKI